MEFVSPEGLRQDGRRAQELRQLKCELGVLDEADGSASLEMGNTKVLAAVVGPRASSIHSGLPLQASVRCEVAAASFSTGTRRKRQRSDRRLGELSALTRDAMEQTIMLELLPKVQIDVYIQILQADGGERAACINAGMLALAHAGIPLRDMIASCSVGYLESVPLLDMNQMEYTGQGPEVTMAAHPNLDKVAMLQTQGNLQFDTLEEICSLALEGCKAVGQFMRTHLLEHTRMLAVAKGAAMS